MNPIRRSALAIAATCGTVALTNVVAAAPSIIAPTLNSDEESPVALEPPSTGEPCVEPSAPTPETAPVQGFVPESTTTTPAATPSASTVPDTTVAPDGVPEPCEPTAPTTVPEPVPTTVPEPVPETVPGETVPGETVPTGPETVPAESVPPVSVETAPAETAPAETVPTVDGPAEAAEAATPIDAAEQLPVEAEIPGPSAGAPAEPVAPLPADNATWASDGSIRLRSPRDPGASLLQPGRTPAVERSVLVDDVELILTTIRQMESGGRYTVGPNRALASGAYQYIPSTWNNYGGYSDAFLAPPEVQDARAREDVIRFLNMYDGDVSMVPVMWYYPRAAVDASWMDRVPSPEYGNRLTIRAYQARWLDRLMSNASVLAGTFVPAPSDPAAVSVLSELPAVPPAAPADPAAAPVAAVPIAEVPTAAAAPVADAAAPVVDPAAAPVVDPAAAPAVDPAAAGTEVAAAVSLDEVTVSEETVELAARSLPPDYDPEEHGVGAMRTIVFPILGPATYADGWGDARDGGLRSHEGTDIVGVQMQPILAAVDGVVSRYQPQSSGIRGVAVTITDADGWRYNYFHNNDDSPGTDDGLAADAFRLAPGVQFGDDVHAGQIIGYLGDSGNAEQSVTHLHFELRDPSGNARPSYWSLRAAEARQACAIGIGEWSTPALADPLPVDPAAVVDPVTVPAAIVDPAAVVDPATVPPAIEHTVVTPLFGEGQWIIDSAGRVTATGDAALIIPRRDLECDAGPAVPFGTEAAGWGELRSDVLEGTVLAGAELAGTVLDGVVPPPPVDPNAAAIVPPADPTATPPAPIVPVPDATAADDAAIVEDDPIAEPMVFTDPATGETIIVVFDLPVQRSDRLVVNGFR